MKKLFYFLLIFPFVFAGCNDDDDNGPAKTTANFTVTIENVATNYAFLDGDVFDTPVGDPDIGPATPGKAYEFTINAGRKQHLSFATMLAATNDLFFGPDDGGIALYDANGDPISGDVTDQVYLWDAGTEVNEEPAVGPNTVTNQPAANTGEDENGTVLKIGDVTGDDFVYPATSEIIKVTITHVGGTEFTVTIQDLSTAELETSEGTKDAPISRGVWVVHNGDNPLYTEGEADLGLGLEAIAEDGDPTTLGDYIENNQGVTYPISPGVWVVHSQGTYPIFTADMEDYGDGLEAIAEDGNASILEANLSSLEGEKKGAIFNTPKGGNNAGPLLPGSSYEFSFTADVNDNLSFVSMLAATNDIFLGTPGLGIPLFDSNGDPISEEITSQLSFWDAGTEVNERPSIGPFTVTNQLAVDTGTEETEAVRLLSKVNDGYTYPTVSQVVKVTITSNN